MNRVRAACRLSVRLVTDAMLSSSITVRLANIDQAAFLSPLYDRFLSALAAVIPTTDDNIFIVNVQDDTDVREKILNVSFSVRAGGGGGGGDVFHTPQFLKERVYLQRVLLGKLSTIKVCNSILLIFLFFIFSYFFRLSSFFVFFQIFCIFQTFYN